MSEEESPDFDEGLSPEFKALQAKKPKKASPWYPITNPRHLKHLSKWAEEAGELVSALCRCIMQGMEGKHPVTGVVNKDWLEDEIADVMALCERGMEYFALDKVRIAKRMAEKKAFHDVWFDN